MKVGAFHWDNQSYIAYGALVTYKVLIIEWAYYYIIIIIYNRKYYGYSIGRKWGIYIVPSYDIPIKDVFNDLQG